MLTELEKKNPALAVLLHTNKPLVKEELLVLGSLHKRYNTFVYRKCSASQEFIFYLSDRRNTEVSHLKLKEEP